MPNVLVVTNASAAARRCPDLLARPSTIRETRPGFQYVFGGAADATHSTGGAFGSVTLRQVPCVRTGKFAGTLDIIGPGKCR